MIIAEGNDIVAHLGVPGFEEKYKTIKILAIK
jgi:hypothetical protein